MTEADTIRVLLVDDELLARDSLRHLLQSDPEITIVGECGDGATAVAAIDELAPDLVFLDIQMPAVDGFETLARLPSRLEPEIVFVTAYDSYAVRAFAVHALDYLLKPVGRERFAEALDRAKARIRQRAAEGTGSPNWTGLLRDAGEPEERYLTRIAVRLNGRIRFVQTGEIDWIEAADYYSCLHVGKRSYLIRRTMKSLESELDPGRFLRVHRGAIVQVDRVVELERLEHGGYSVLLTDGTRVKLSRGRRGALEYLLAG